MRQKFKILFLALILATLVLGPIISQAAGLVPCGGCAKYDKAIGKCIQVEPTCKFCHFFVMLERIINFILFTIAPPLAVLMLTVGGAMFIFAGGKPTLASKGRAIMTSVIIGLVIVYASWVIVNTFFTFIGASAFEIKNPETGKVFIWKPSEWFKINCTKF